MTAIPLENTNEELTANEEQCYIADKINAPSLFQTFRLYLPRYPRQDINTLFEIPLVASREFALSIENFLSNTIHLHLIHDYDHHRMVRQMRMECCDKVVTMDVLNSMNNYSKMKGCIEIRRLKQNEYRLENPSHRLGAVVVKIFRNIPASCLKSVIDNSIYYCRLQSSWFLQLIALWHFPNDHSCIRIMENCCLNLQQLNDVVLREKEIIDNETRSEVCLFLLAELLVAVDNLHERGITHRLLTPENIYFDLKGHIKIGCIYEAMNLNSGLTKLLSNWSQNLDDQMGLSWYLDKNYLDPEILTNLLQKHVLEAYLMMDCLADIFSIGVMVTECMAGYNIIENTLRSYIHGDKDLLPKEEPYVHIKHDLLQVCWKNDVSPEFQALLQLTMLPRVSRMRGLRMRIQRHRFLSTDGCEMKMRIDLVKYHPAFYKKISLDDLLVMSSPVMRLLAMLNSS